jgi:rubredoxin
LLTRYGTAPTAETDQALDGVAPLPPEPSAASGARSESKWTCPACDYVYDEQIGAVREGYSAGTVWAEIPEDFNCPDCGVRDKVDFVPYAA